MPQYQPDLTTITAGFELLPDGVYEFLVGAPKPWERNDETKGLSHGIRYALTVNEIIEGEGIADRVGKRVVFTCRMHDDMGSAFAKQFLMAAKGYGMKEEQQFNADNADADWSYDTEDKTAGEIWTSIEGSTVHAVVSTRPNKQDPDHEGFQEFTWIKKAA